MFDPGAIGTLIIGLDHIRHEDELAAAAARRPQRPGRIRRFRSVLAAGLHALAGRIDRLAAALPTDRAGEQAR